MIDRRDFLKNFVAGGAAAFVFCRLPTFEVAAAPGQAVWAEDDNWAQVPEILKRIKAPVFPKRDFDIRRFGAVADGKTDCTDAIRKAVAECHKARGGRVIVPAGTFHTGAIHLISNVNLYVAEGATLKFSTNPARYLPVVFTRYEGTEVMSYSPLIYAFEQENVAVSGRGTLDGGASDENWWAWSRRRGSSASTPSLSSNSIRQLRELAERGAPVSERVFGAGHYLRPQFIQPYRCKNVLIEGVKIINSPMWEIHPVLSTNVTVRGVTISTHGPNNDGCDPESCRDVLIEDCYFDTGDDCIAVKSGRNADGRRLNVPAENIIIRNCTMKDGHGGITIGSEISGGVRNLFAEHCRLDSPHLDTALRIKNNAMRGGLLENLYFRNIEVGQVARAVITIDFNYEEGEKGQFTPVVRNFVVKDLKSGKSRRALDVQGFKRAPIYNLRLENCTFADAAESSIVRNVEGLTFRKVYVNGNLVEG